VPGLGATDELLGGGGGGGGSDELLGVSCIEMFGQSSPMFTKQSRIDPSTSVIASSISLIAPSSYKLTAVPSPQAAKKVKKAVNAKSTK